ncbi:CPBP family intramembrane metalloprotease [bacterium]|nr:CPBP family intramembrane metalloprotease [bacterium]RQV96367.1 MAG: CPBP family intramembrane metalloprotease [bacterium]
MKSGENHYPTAQSALLIIIMTLLLVTGIGILWELREAKWELLLLELLMAMPVLIFILVRKYSFSDLLKWKKVRVNVLLASSLIGLGFIPLSDEVDTLIQSAFPMPYEVTSALEKFLMINTTEEWIIILLAGVLIASISEELLFRGFLLTSLEQTMRPTVAIVISACLFAVVHFNPWWMMTIWMTGLLLGFLALRSGSIFPAMVVHGLNNGVSILLANVNSARLEASYYLNGHVSPLWIAASLISLGFGLYLFCRFTKNGG